MYKAQCRVENWLSPLLCLWLKRRRKGKQRRRITTKRPVAARWWIILERGRSDRFRKVHIISRSQRGGTERETNTKNTSAREFCTMLKSKAPSSAVEGIEDDRLQLRTFSKQWMWMTVAFVACRRDSLQHSRNMLIVPNWLGRIVFSADFQRHKTKSI